jgi:hypothetical protein
MRAVGALGISVGTSLAFELMSPSTTRSVDTVLFNLRTLIRNAKDAYEKEDSEKNNVEQLVKDVVSDLTLLGKWVEQNRAGKPVQMVVYYPTYSGLARKFPHATLWEPTTDLQKANVKLVKDVAKELLLKYPKLIIKTDVGMPEWKGKGLVMTHHVVDLADISGIGRLHLLESYTGTVKPFTMWNTKLTGGGDLHFIPFNKLTIQIFGDKSTNFRSSSHGIKELLKKVADEGKWTSATSYSRVRGTINGLPQGVDRAGLLMMM